jgi:hypothetical protein
VFGTSVLEATESQKAFLFPICITRNKRYYAQDADFWQLFCKNANSGKK